MIVNKPFEAFSVEDYEDQIRVNSSAAFALARAVAPGMKRKRYGKIINFCSLTLNGRWDGYVPYVASKGAMLGLTKSLARELGPHGVRVNAISPGAVVSEAEARVFGDRLPQYNDWVPREPVPQGTHPTIGGRKPRPFPCLVALRHDHRPEHRHRRRLVVKAAARSRCFDGVAEVVVVPDLGAALASYDIVVGGPNASLPAVQGPLANGALRAGEQPAPSLVEPHFAGRFFFRRANFMPLRRTSRVSLTLFTATDFRARGRLKTPLRRAVELSLTSNGPGPFRYAAHATYALSNRRFDDGPEDRQSRRRAAAFRPWLSSLDRANAGHASESQSGSGRVGNERSSAVGNGADRVASASGISQSS